MSKRISDEWNIPAPREKVWKILLQVYQWPHWMPGVRAISGIAMGHIALANAQFESSTAGFPLLQDLSIDEIIENKKLVVTRRLPGMNTTSTYELFDLDDGTTKLVRTVETSGILGHVAGIMSSSGKSDIEVKLAQLLQTAEEPLVG